MVKSGSVLGDAVPRDVSMLETRLLASVCVCVCVGTCVYVCKYMCVYI